MEEPRPEHVPVVGERDAVHPQRLHPRDEVGDAVGAVEERVLGVGMEVREGHRKTQASPAFRGCQRRAGLSLTGRGAAASVRPRCRGARWSACGFCGVLTPVVGAAVVASGCGDQPAAPRAVVGDVALAPGGYALYTGSRAAGPLRFPAAGAAGAEYLVVGQFATARADLSSTFSLTGSLPATAVARQPPPAPAALPAAVRFHDAIRRMDEAAARASLRLGAGAGRADRESGAARRGLAADVPGVREPRLQLHGERHRVRPGGGRAQRHLPGSGRRRPSAASRTPISSSSPTQFDAVLYPTGHAGLRGAVRHRRQRRGHHPAHAAGSTRSSAGPTARRRS